MDATQLVQALFYELDISASAEVQSYVVQRIYEMASSYDFESPYGYYSNNELQSLFNARGTKIWGAMNHYKALKGDDSQSVQGTYNPNSWNNVVDYADYYGNRNGEMSASELIYAVQIFMGYYFSSTYTNHWVNLLQTTICPINPFNSGGRISTTEMK
jgi:hypothetical protein